jgi:hypothetical protein
VAALGSEYVAPGYTTREVSGVAEAITYKLTGTVDGTALAYDPSPPPAAPLSLNEGQSAEFSASSAFVVSSQDAAHPFSLTQYMSSGWDSSAAGCTPDGGPCGLGDPEWVILPTPAQFLEHYDFFTDPTFATTNLAVIRQAADGGFQDVSLACLGGPIANWTSVGAQGKYQVAYLDLYRSGAGVGGCGVSWHQAASAAPFGVVVWGTDSYASYAYSAGGGLAPLNNVIVNP